MSHPNPRKVLPPIFVILILASLAYWYFGVRPAQANSGELSASGTIEATQIRISPELGGKTVDVAAAEGDTVKVSDLLVQFDTALLDAQRAQAAAAVEVAKANAGSAQANARAVAASQSAAEAAVSAANAARDAAQANLDLLQAGATTEQLAASQAQVAIAQANLQAAQASYAALTAGARPEEVSAARVRLDWARSEYYGLVVTLTSDQLDELRTAVNQAGTNLKNAETRQSDLQADTRTPPAVLNALPFALADAQSASDAAHLALDAADNSILPFYQQIEAARQSNEAAQLALSQAKARQSALQGVDDITTAARDALQSAVDDAQGMADAARTAYDALNNSTQANQLKASWNDAQKALTDLNKMARGGSTPLESVLNQLDAAAAGETAAQANYQNLKNGARPEQIVAAQAQVDSATAQIDSAAANLESAKAKAAAALSSAAAAQAQVDAAQAALDVLDIQLAKLTINAPADGVILTRAIEPGEIASPGATLFTLADLSKLTITVYVPEDRYGEITLGETASVTVDSFPGETFTAVVAYIASKAEFTPRNVQTAEGRRTTVFAVKLTIQNTAGKLKPGMPADVGFGK